MTRPGRAALLAVVLCCVASAVQAYVPVYVMLPLDTISSSGTVVNNAQQLQADFAQLKAGGVDGVMTDVWWGIVEQSPRQYQWAGYQQLFGMIQQAGLKAQVVMSFHQCGGNVGDDCDIPLPQFATKVGPRIFYQDASLSADFEYISLGADNEPVLDGGRTPVQAYSNFMQSFNSTFGQLIDAGIITMVEVGLGPAGEMRYSSYQSSKWSFCGVGAFQSYDPFMVASWTAYVRALGHPEWSGMPTDAGSYNSRPYDTNFFRDGGGYESDYGVAFLGWYSGLLIKHGQTIIGAARNIFGSSVSIAAKIAGVHWWFLSESHAAELTAGYWNTRSRDGYKPIVDMLATFNATFDFTALEMVDSEQPAACECGPAELVEETRNDAFNGGIQYGGENALPRYDSAAYQQILAQSSALGKTLSAFSYLRLDDTLLNGDAWNTFKTFVSEMHALSG